MELDLKSYVRRPFTVTAIRVTDENMSDVADWCEGEIRTTANGTSFIKVNVNRPATARQTRAFVGDWLLYAGRGFKVYTDRAFELSFEEESDEQLTPGEELLNKIFANTE